MKDGGAGPEAARRERRGLRTAERSAGPAPGRLTLLALEGVSCHFTMGGGRVLKAVDRVDLSLDAGQTYALVGESGCGKSTLAKLVLGLERLHAGRVVFDGVDVADLNRDGRRRFRARVQAVFQDPYSSLNPRLRVGTILAEPLSARGERGRSVQNRTAEVLELVGLPENAGRLYPHEFSGGQRQRIAIARALVPKPDLIVLDEPVSALDVSIRAQILNLLLDLQEELSLSYLLIAHDLALVEHTSDRLGVMYLGEIVESGPSEEVFAEPRHPYTQALLAAVPRPDPAHPRASGHVTGEIATALDPPSGCRFHPRCPYAMEVCRSLPPSGAQSRGNTATTEAYLVKCHLMD